LCDAEITHNQINESIANALVYFIMRSYCTETINDIASLMQ